MDNIDKFYLVCEIYDDDLDRVVIAIKMEGAKKRPSHIMRDIVALWVDKYSKQLDSIITKHKEGWTQ